MKWAPGSPALAEEFWRSLIPSKLLDLGAPQEKWEMSLRLLQNPCSEESANRDFFGFFPPPRFGC